MKPLPLLVALLLLFPLSLAAADAHSTSAETLSKGLAAFRRAAEAKDPAKATVLYRTALAGFRELIRRKDIRNGAIYYDIGNVYERLGNIGRALLNYRRAALYAPSDPQLHHNLAYVRTKRQDNLPVSRAPLVLRLLFFWHYDLPVETQALVFSIAFGMLWLWLGMRLLTARRWMRWPAVGAGLVASLLLVSLGWAQLRLATQRSGVIIAAEVTARQGDGLSYDPAFKAPLHSGDEFTLLARRPEWYHIHLSDGTDAWIPQSSAELVRPLSP